MVVITITRILKTNKQNRRHKGNKKVAQGDATNPP